MAHLPPQTLRQARAAYKKREPGYPEWEPKQMVRRAELQRCADRIKSAEARRKEMVFKRKKKEEKERQARKQLGIRLATQLAGYSRTQI